MKMNGSSIKSRLQILALLAISHVAVLYVLSTNKNVGPSALPSNAVTKSRTAKRLQIAGENHTVGLAAVINDQITLEPKCQRPCTRRNNIIYFADSPAGLSDRKVILRDLSQLAGYLCAELVLPPPSALLSKDHNYGRPISNNVAWSDLFNITCIEDGVPAIRSPFEEFGTDFDSWTNFPVFNTTSDISKYGGWIHIIYR